ncbi:hypothetical protein CTRI78_v000035 [Colletotrichum trifolii]|uniref:Uncharacterized protein n=2 Tax=Colletotrichum orbiculare species complex TaxID=2707354 RepID=A0A4R8RSK2_COLTR|nr:hypothetical protein CTRI78_v000035 [Colletotrichum trifolii]
MERFEGPQWKEGEPGVDEAMPSINMLLKNAIRLQVRTTPGSPSPHRENLVRKILSLASGSIRTRPRWHSG